MAPLEIGFGSILLLFLALIVVVLVIVQVQIRKQYEFVVPLQVDQVRQAVANEFRRQGASLVGDDLEIPYHKGIMSVHVAPEGTGSNVHVWLSRYAFLNANGFQVLGYRRFVNRVRKSIHA